MLVHVIIVENVIKQDVVIWIVQSRCCWTTFPSPIEIVIIFLIVGCDAIATAIVVIIIVTVVIVRICSLLRSGCKVIAIAIIIAAGDNCFSI